MALFPPFRLGSWADEENVLPFASFSQVLVEITTYPPVFHWLKAVVYILIILLTAETAASLQPSLTPRNVPHVITTSVVMASLLVIVADWGFSQLWLLRK
jgi:hypothetical protein